MKQKHLFLPLLSCVLLILTIPAAWAYQSETSAFVKAYYPDKQTVVQILQMDEFDAYEMDTEAGYLVILANADEQKKLKTMGFVLEAYPDYDMHKRRDPSAKAEGTIQGYECYKIVESAFEIMDEMVSSNPDLAATVDIGDSWDKENGNGGYDLRVLKLTNQSISGSKPKLFVVGSLHAREYTTAELNIRFAQHLIDQYNVDPDVTWMLDHHEAHLLFYMNPDGRKYAEAGQSWRKNTNANYCGQNSSKRGCDLNRNFDYQWGSSGTNDECSLTYYGSSPASEPEVQAVQNYLKEIFTTNGQGIYIDLHSFGEIIMSANNSGLNAMQSKFEYFNGYDRALPLLSIAAKDDVLYRGGMTFQYGYHEVGVASFLFELGTSFFQDCSYFENNILAGNLDALKYALRTCSTPFELPFGPDAMDISLNNNVLTATIDDTNYGGGNISSSNIAQAEYYIDIAPWQDNAAAVPMSASDGSFNAESETVEADLNLSNLETGRHIIYVRGQDAEGSWGPVSAIFAGE
ncbi:MAG: peptidase M14 [Desulfobacteraceae bacterium]|nr:peptidase M14 [Desulfobacteraceae bacterium]